jgi:hypothetical protein
MHELGCCDNLNALRTRTATDKKAPPHDSSYAPVIVFLREEKAKRHYPRLKRVNPAHPVFLFLS